MVLLACVESVQVGRLLLPKVKPVKIEAKYLPRSRGNPHADLWIVEYLDFQCKSCRESVTIMDDYFAKYPKDIYQQIRYYPLIQNHIYALKSAIYTECSSRQKKFWEFSGALFESQAHWSVLPDPDSFFISVAREKGLDLKALQACVEDPSVKAEVLSEREEGKTISLHMTPTFFINGEKIEGVPAMKSALESYFSKKYPRGKR